MSKQTRRPKAKLTGLRSIAEARIQKARETRAVELDLSSLGLTDLPKSIAQLTQLQKLFLDDNQLTTLPKSIGQLSQLNLLYLRRNHLTRLPESIGQLSQLRRLHLEDNRLTMLPESLRKLTQLKQLYLQGNEALGLPAEVLGPRWIVFSYHAEPATILDYYFRAQGGKKRPLNEAKLILVGRGAVGKTSIVNRLIHRKFKDEKKTEGIQITEWPLTVGEKRD